MLRILLAVSAPALTLLAVAGPATAQSPSAPLQSTPGASQPPESALGWNLEKDTGTCVLRKGGDHEPQLAMTSRGRMMVSDPALPDPMYMEGQKAELTLRWSDQSGLTDRVEVIEAATLTLPGGGTQRLKPRKAYIIPYDTLALAQRYSGGTGISGGFVLTIERGGTTMWSMDTSGSAVALKALIECADSVMIKQVQQPVASQPTPKKRR